MNENEPNEEKQNAFGSGIPSSCFLSPCLFLPQRGWHDSGSLLWLIPVLPALGALVNGVFGWKWEKNNRKVISFVALCSTALSLLLALWNIAWLMGLSWESLPALPGNVTADAAHHSVSLHLAQWIPGARSRPGGEPASSGGGCSSWTRFPA
jgi:hypothetical protein